MMDNETREMFERKDKNTVVDFKFKWNKSHLKVHC